LHQTSGDVLMLTASGTGPWKRELLIFSAPAIEFWWGIMVIWGTLGESGESIRLNVDVIKAEWGKPLDPEAFTAKLTEDKEKAIKAVIITHSETSTGVLNDLESINKAVKDHGEALIIVDAVTSLGAYPIPIDEWGLDVVGSGSQKGYMIPPGLGLFP